MAAETPYFETGFESEADFAGFYITSVTLGGSDRQELSGARRHSGGFSYRAWIVAPNPESNVLVNRNHRAYPTIQFQHLPSGPVPTPICTTFYVWADFDLADRPGALEDQWFSLATFTSDPSDHWFRTVLVNVVQDGRVLLQHVPRQGQQSHIFQSTTQRFHYRQWQRIDVELDFSDHGYAKVWLNRELVSHAAVEQVDNQLAQAHFGLYAAPSLGAGEIFNDDLTIAPGRCGL